jgi:predicted nucleotidyltransferase
MTRLDEIAQQLHVSGRTLRRAATRGTIRSSRPSARKIEVSPQEAEFVRRQWQVLSGMVRVLRTQPNVRLAVLFGSVARGDENDKSDLDVLVRYQEQSVHALALLQERLEEAGGRADQVVELEADETSALLLADVLRDGRMLVDRDGGWARLERRERLIGKRAAWDDEQLTRAVERALVELNVS